MKIVSFTTCHWRHSLELLLQVELHHHLAVDGHHLAHGRLEDGLQDVGHVGGEGRDGSLACHRLAVRVPETQSARRTLALRFADSRGGL